MSGVHQLPVGESGCRSPPQLAFPGVLHSGQTATGNPVGHQTCRPYPDPFHAQVTSSCARPFVFGHRTATLVNAMDPGMRLAQRRGLLIRARRWVHGVAPPEFEDSVSGLSAHTPFARKELDLMSTACAAASKVTSRDERPRRLRRRTIPEPMILSWLERVSANHRREISNRWHAVDARIPRRAANGCSGFFITGRTNW